VLPQICEVNGRVDAPEQDLDLLLIEHTIPLHRQHSPMRGEKELKYIPEPSSVNHFQKTLEERLALKFDLLTEAVVRYQLHVLQPILSGDSYVASIRNEV
jgi:hypothetical protein